MILRFESVTKVFRSSLTLKPTHTIGPLTFGIEPGEIFGYLGPNGAGKTTTIKMAVGLLKPSKGRISCFGKDVTCMDVRSRIGFLPEHPYFYQHLTASELLEFYGGLFGLGFEEARRRAVHLLDITGLAKFGKRRISKFSKGMLQRIGFAQALMNDPDLVILDEPLAGLDPVGRKQMRDLILDLKQNGKTVFLSSHILQDIEMICDRVGILWEGKIVKIARVEEILDQSIKGLDICVEGISIESAANLNLGKVRRTHDGIVITCPADTDTDIVIQRLMRQGARIRSILPQRQTLEDYFMAEIGDLRQPMRRDPEESLASSEVSI